MRVFKIKKRRGEYRTVYAPNSQERRVLRRMAGHIDQACWRHCEYHVVHGFMRGKSPVTNAEQHVGFKHTLCMDLKDFFDSVKPEHVEQYLPAAHKDILKVCFVDGRARQGLPTSPALSNLAMIPYDRQIEALARAVDPTARYTRYADDLTISFNMWIGNTLNLAAGTLVGRTYEVISRGVAYVLDPEFQLNHRKTSVQSASGGRRIITGVAVDGTGVYPTRKVRRKLRAALHQGNTSSASGLAEWCSLKRPHKCRDTEEALVRRHIIANVPSLFDQQDFEEVLR